MSEITAAQTFVTACELAKPKSVLMGPETKDAFIYDAAKQQATVVGADLIAFSPGVTAQDREDIANASALAQLVAKKQAGNPTTLDGWRNWYDAYFDTLSRIGFAIQDKTFVTHKAVSDDFEAHEVVIQLATELALGVPAVAFITTALEALRKTGEGSSWIKLFSRESESAHTARFQVTLAGTNPDGSLFTQILAFGLDARTTVTKVLFFRFTTNTVTLERNAGTVSINRQVLGGVRTQLVDKLKHHASNFIAGLEI